METLFVLLALCEGNPPVTGGHPSERPVARSFDVFFDLRLNKWLIKHSRRRWFETLSGSLWFHCHVFAILSTYNKIIKGKIRCPVVPHILWYTLWITSIERYKLLSVLIDLSNVSYWVCVIRSMIFYLLQHRRPYFCGVKDSVSLNECWHYLVYQHNQCSYVCTNNELILTHRRLRNEGNLVVHQLVKDVESHWMQR